MLQSFLTQPDAFASALGMARVKRSAYDKEFNAMGVKVGIDYIDPNNQLKGGKLDVSVDNLKRIFPKARSEKVELSVNFNGGDNARDGLFTLSVDYELNHINKEEGTFNAERTFDGKNWATKMSVKSKNNPKIKIIPVFDMAMKSDRQTFLDGTYSCDHGNNWEFNVKRVPGEKMDAIIQGNGKTYIINGVRDNVNKKVNIDIDADGVKYSVVLSMAGTTAEKLNFQGTVNLGGSGKYEVTAAMKKDMTDASFNVMFNDRTLLSALVKGKVDPATGEGKYELRYSAVGMGEGKIRLGLKPLPDLKIMFQYLPKGKPDLKILITRKKTGAVIEWSGLATKNKEVMLKYDNKIVPADNADSLELNFESTFHVSENSLLYPKFCSYGCFNDRTAKGKVYITKATPYKFSVAVELFKDSASVLTLDVNTLANPYVFKIFAPRILPKILPTGRESIEFKADHAPGSYLKVTSNTNSLKSFSVEKIAGTNERKIELNGKELVRGGFSKGDNEISNTVTLPDGKSLTTTIKWEHDDLNCNKVNIKLDGTERKLDLAAEWDFKNPADMSFKVDAEGENKRIGKYNFKRDGKISAANGVLKGGWTGVTGAESTPWPSPVNTDVSFDLNSVTHNFVFNITKIAAGKKFSINYNNGRFSIDF